MFAWPHSPEEPAPHVVHLAKAFLRQARLSVGDEAGCPIVPVIKVGSPDPFIDVPGRRFLCQTGALALRRFRSHNAALVGVLHAEEPFDRVGRRIGVHDGVMGWAEKDQVPERIPFFRGHRRHSARTTCLASHDVRLFTDHQSRVRDVLRQSLTATGESAPVSGASPKHLARLQRDCHGREERTHLLPFGIPRATGEDGDVADGVIENPILNSPFREPSRHWRFADTGITNEVVDERRVSSYFMPIPASKVRSRQLELETQWTRDRIEENRLINQVRERVAVWRSLRYPGVTPTTRRLLEYWTDDTRERPLFFCQVEALETVIYLTECADKQGDVWIGNELRRLAEDQNPGLSPYGPSRW